MNIGLFIERLKFYFDNILDEDLIASNSGEQDSLGRYEWTYLFSIVLYHAIRDYNLGFIDKNCKKYSGQNPQIIVAPENGGRMPSDFTLQTRNNEVVLNIEHENSEDRIDKNFGKLLDSINKCPGLLIAYLGKNQDPTAVINMLRGKKASKKEGTKNKIHLLLGKYQMNSSKNFIYSII
jgi:hypothetical protein